MSTFDARVSRLERHIGTRGCDSCSGPESWCLPTCWVAPDGTETYTGTPEFCPDCGRHIWPDFAARMPGGKLQIFRISGIAAEDAP